MEKKEIILEYKGQLTFTTIGRLISLLKYKMVQKGVKPGVYKRILSVMIEALENVYKNNGPLNNSLSLGKNYMPEFQLEKNETRYYITVSNPINKSEIAKLSGKLELVNSKSPEELRILYRQTILDGKFTDKGGAGLGIIEMAKISGNPMNFSFTPIDKDNSYFTLTIVFD